MRILLIEDETLHREKYVKCAENLPYSVELSTANGQKKGVETAEKEAFDVILLDLELNESDGDGISFLQWLKFAKLKQKPFVIVITNNSAKTTHNIARNLGADYIFTKNKPDYTPRLVFDFARNFITNLPQEERKKKSSLEDIVASELEKIGFTPDVIGTEYLIHAIATVIYTENPKVSLEKDIYPVLARRFRKTDWSISRAIRTAIIRTWRLTDTLTLQENYTCNIDYNTGIPTNKQMILYVADKIKRENSAKSILVKVA